MLPIRNISYLLPMCCSFWEKYINSPKTGLGCSTPLSKIHKTILDCLNVSHQMCVILVIKMFNFEHSLYNSSFENEQVVESKKCRAKEHYNTETTVKSERRGRYTAIQQREQPSNLLIIILLSYF